MQEVEIWHRYVPSHFGGGRLPKQIDMNMAPVDLARDWWCGPAYRFESDGPRLTLKGIQGHRPLKDGLSPSGLLEGTGARWETDAVEEPSDGFGNRVPQEPRESKPTRRLGGAQARQIKSGELAPTPRPEVLPHYSILRTSPLFNPTADGAVVPKGGTLMSGNRKVSGTIARPALERKRFVQYMSLTERISNGWPL